MSNVMSLFFTVDPGTEAGSTSLISTLTPASPLPSPHLQHPSNSTAIISSLVAAAVFILILVVAAVILGLCIATKITRKKKERERLEQKQKGKPPPLLPMLRYGQFEKVLYLLK